MEEESDQSRCATCISTYRKEITATSDLNIKNDKDWANHWGHDGHRCFKTWQSHFIYRIVYWILFTIVFIFSWATRIVFDRESRFYLVFLTNWNVVLGWALSSLFLYITWTARPSNVDNLTTTPPWYVRVAAVLHYVVLAASILIVVVFWTIVFNPPLVFASSVLSHGINLLLTLVDTFVSSYPYRLLPAYLYTVAFAIVYLIWTLIHFYTEIGTGLRYDDNGTSTEYMAIYPITDYDKPAVAAISLLLLIFVGLPIIVLSVRCCVFVRDKCQPQVLPNSNIELMVM